MLMAEAVAWLENYRQVYEARFAAMDALLEDLKATQPQGQKGPSNEQA